jgi:hypothetical protein
MQSEIRESILIDYADRPLLHSLYPKVFWVSLAAFFQASMSLAIYILFYESQFAVIIDPWNSGES